MLQPWTRTRFFSIEIARGLLMFYVDGSAGVSLTCAVQRNFFTNAPKCEDDRRTAYVLDCRFDSPLSISGVVWAQRCIENDAWAVREAEFGCSQAWAISGHEAYGCVRLMICASEVEESPADPTTETTPGSCVEVIRERYELQTLEDFGV
jgi:hypothetical protein